MRQIFNALLKYKNTYLFLGLLFISFLIVNQRSFYHKSVFSAIGLGISSNLYGVSKGISDYFKLKKINGDLIKENNKLKALELIYFQNQILKQKTLDTFNFEVTSAKIIKNSFNKANNYLIINKGHEDGVIEDMGVISTDGVIGVVNETRAHHSSVISILHQEIKVNVSFKKNGAYGSLSWPGIHPKKMTLDDISTINSVSVGDTIVTGGMSAYFPFGIPIGVVSKFVQPKTEGYYQIEVDLFSNLTQKEFAYVIKNKDLHEIKKLTSDVSK